MEGATIGQYRVTGTIGQGGMGAVYAGVHVLLGRPAAIKVLLPELSQKQDMVMRFFNEARAATAIRHPGIVEIYDFGWSADGAAFIVMEHLEGETLARRLERGRLRWNTALAIVRQIAGALGAAHSKGIVHRDLKPDNIFLVLDPEVPGGERIKLLDFGIAKLAGEAGPGMNMTRTGAVMGTPTYMSPEQCRGVAADHRADLYALGCIAFELCGGRPPFIGEGAGDVLAAHIHVRVPSMASVGGVVPSEVESLVLRLLAKSPADRIQGAAELIRAIDMLSTDGARFATSVAARMLPSVAALSTTTLSGSAGVGGTGSTPGRGGRHTLAIGAAIAAVFTVATLMIVAVVVRGRGEAVTQAPPVLIQSDTPAMATPGPKMSPTSSAAQMPPSTSPETRGEPRPPAPPAPPQQPAAVPTAPAPDVARPLPATVEVAIESIPGGAQVVLDGTVLGKTPYRGTIPWPGGEVTLLVRLVGYIDRHVVVRAHQPVHESLKLVRTIRVAPRPRDLDQSVNPF